MRSSLYWIVALSIVLSLVPMVGAQSPAKGYKVSMNEKNGQNLTANLDETILFVGPAFTNATYTWDFGDGNTADGRDVTHKFTEGGEFRVVLSVVYTNNESMMAQADYSVVISIEASNGLQSWALVSVGVMMAIAGIASAMGLGIAGTSAVALASEKEVSMGKVVALSALPFTQAIYAFAISYFILSGTGLIGGAGVPEAKSSSLFIGMFGIAMIVGITGISAIPQGISAGATLSAIGKREEAFLPGLIVSVMPETVAMFGFVLAFLALLSLGLM